jgi:flagellar protein FliL
MEGWIIMAADPKTKIDSKPIVENKINAEPKGKSRMLLIGIGGLFLMLAGGLGVFAYYHYKSSVAEENAQAKANAKLKKEIPMNERIKATLPLEPFLVNLADTEEIRFVKTTFQLGLSEPASEEAKGPAAIAAMRDSIISLLSSKTANQILTVEGKDLLRKEILLRVKTVAPKVKVLEVFIVDFVVQL